MTGYFGEGLLCSAALVFVGWIFWILLRRRNPEPHMTLLLALLRDFPKGGQIGNLDAGMTSEAEPENDPGPFGPGSFSHLA